MQNTIVCIILSLLLHLTTQQFDTPKIINLTKTPQIVKILSSSNPNNPNIILGFADGQIRCIQTYKNKNVFLSNNMFNKSVQHIEINYKSQVMLVATANSIILMNRRYEIQKRMNFQNEILGLSIAQEQNGRGFMAIHMKARIMEEEYTTFLQQKVNSDFIVLSVAHPGAYNMKYSPNHKYLYLVNNTRSQFTIYNVQNPQKMHPNITKIQAYSKTTNLPYFKLSKTKFQLSRKFNFQIKWMILDNKNPQTHHHNNKMILVSDENVIFYVDKGNIMTYIPYSNFIDQLIGVDFCQNNYIVIVYKHIVQNTSYFYLNLVFKDTAHSFKTISLNDIFGQIQNIKQVDCNSNMILLVTTNKQLLILKGFHVFQWRPYVNYRNLQRIGFFFLILSLFLKDKSNPRKQLPDEDSQDSEEQQDDQSKVSETEDKKQSSQQISTSQKSQNTKNLSNK